MSIKNLIDHINLGLEQDIEMLMSDHSVVNEKFYKDYETFIFQG